MRHLHFFLQVAEHFIKSRLHLTWFFQWRRDNFFIFLTTFNLRYICTHHSYTSWKSLQRPLIGADHTEDIITPGLACNHPSYNSCYNLICTSFHQYTNDICPRRLHPEMALTRGGCASWLVHAAHSHRRTRLGVKLYVF